MAFWLAVLLGALFAWLAVQSGFYAAWILFFNLWVSAYMAVFLTPLAVANIPAATTMPYGYGLAMLSIGAMTFAIAYGLSFACLSGRLSMPLPKALDNVGAGLLGFFSGFLTWSVVAMAVSLTPLADFGVCQTLGLDAASQATNRGYVCWWCNRFHDFVSVAHSTQTSQDAVATLLHKAVPTTSETPTPSVDATGETSPSAPAPPPPAPPSLDTATTGSTTTGMTGTNAAGTTTEGSFTQTDTAATEQTTGVTTSTATVDNATIGTAPAIVGSTSETAPEKSAGTSPSVPSLKTPHTMAATTPSKKTTPEKTQPGQTSPADSFASQLSRRTAILQSPDALATIVANANVSTLEVAPFCTLEKFAPETARRLQQWVSDGGLLLVNNNVLGLFGVACEPLTDRGPMVCVPAGPSHPVLAGCHRVVLQTPLQKVRILPIGDVLPLLKLEKPDKGGDEVVWSLAPYGKGWVSDAKAVDVSQDDGPQFWRNFCEFCLAARSKSSTGSTTSPNMPAANGPLTGVWQASAGAQFRIAEGDKTVSVRLCNSDALLMCSGIFTRSSDHSDTSSWKGTLYVILTSDVTVQHAVHATMTLDSPTRLRVRCKNWPVLNPRTGKYFGRTIVEVWNRVDEPLFHSGLLTTPAQPPHAAEP